MNSEKVYLMILDGFGEGKASEGNAITKAKMDHFNELKKKYPHTLLNASGEEVGLPAHTQGGSEVGHFTIGMGRIIFQTLEEINKSIENKSFFSLPELEKAKNYLQENPQQKLHLLGMISDQGIHADIHHLFALLEWGVENKIPEIFIHAITDGRDVPEKSAQKFIDQIEEKISQLQNPITKISIATIIGRFYAMDRDNNWDRTQQAYDLVTTAKGTPISNATEAIQKAYADNIESDYYIPPFSINPTGKISNNDVVVFWNFRTDRTKQLTFCFTQETSIGAKIHPEIKPYFICFGDYSKKAPVLFPTKIIQNNLGAVIETAGLPQLRVAETEKYAHVTYFFNSQVDAPFPHEERVMIDSKKDANYGDNPAMSAREITQFVEQKIDEKKYAFIVQNFANPDLVGHSGNLTATIKACEVIDECIGEIADHCLKNNYHLIITADHGNAESMLYDNGEPCPSHTENPVPFLLISQKYQAKTLKKGGLKDIAPTILEIMNLPKPPEMSGQSLIQ